MSSGNFVIGHDLSLEGFREYILPNLEKYKVKMTDFSPYESEGKKVLVSLIGDANPDALENTINISMKETYATLDKHFKDNPAEFKMVFPSQIGDSENQMFFKNLGSFKDNKTASKVFQNLVVKYSLIDLDSQLGNTESNLKRFKDKFKDF